MSYLFYIFFLAAANTTKWCRTCRNCEFVTKITTTERRRKIDCSFSYAFSKRVLNHHRNEILLLFPVQKLGVKAARESVVLTTSNHKNISL